MKALSPRTLIGRLLLLHLMALSAHGANADTTPNTTCKMTATFPDGTKFVEPCLMTILLAGQMNFNKKGWIRFRDTQNRSEVFSLNFFPPQEIKINASYTVTTDREAGYLNGIVQPAGAHEACHMNENFSSKAMIAFTAVGATDADYHGKLQVYPACYRDMGTPQQSVVPSGQVGAGTILIVF